MFCGWVLGDTAVNPFALLPADGVNNNAAIRFGDRWQPCHGQFLHKFGCCISGLDKSIHTGSYINCF